jgi:hypothetical protein
MFSVFTAVIFLNMSFFLAEISLLEFKDRQIIENICSLVLNGGLEEERDAHSGGSDTALKAFSMATENLLLHHTTLPCFSLPRKCISMLRRPIATPTIRKFSALPPEPIPAS